MAADDDGLQDWVTGYGGEGQERVAGDSGDSGVAMMAAVKMAAVEDSSVGGQQQWQQTMAEDDGSG